MPAPFDQESSHIRAVPVDMLAEQHRRMAESGFGEKANQ